MSSHDPNNLRRWVRSSILLGSVLVAGASIAAWRYASVNEANAATANQPEPVESVTQRRRSP